MGAVEGLQKAPPPTAQAPVVPAAAGDLAKASTDPETHQYGTITLIARALIANNVRPDPANAPKREPNIAREAWAIYPVLIGPA
jgi:hypothetical protein